MPMKTAVSVFMICSGSPMSPRLMRSALSSPSGFRMPIQA